MKLNVRPLKNTDYEDVLCDWWRDWRWTPPARDFLPENGTGGYMVYDNDFPVCAGFMYTTNSNVAWCDWIISNLNYKDRVKRKEALELLVNQITKVAERKGFKYSYALIKNKPLIETYKKLGYKEASSYTSEMIKVL